MGLKPDQRPFECDDPSAGEPRDRELVLWGWTRTRVFWWRRQLAFLDQRSCVPHDFIEFAVLVVEPVHLGLETTQGDLQCATNESAGEDVGLLAVKAAVVNQVREILCEVLLSSVPVNHPFFCPS